MNQGRCVAVAIFALLLAAKGVLADIPSPDGGRRPDSTPGARLAIRVDPNAEQSRIIIPKTLLLRLLQDEADTAVLEIPKTIGPTRQQTAQAGIGLSAVMVGGMFVVVLSRRRKTRSASVAMLIVLVGLGVLAGCAMPDISKPHPEAGQSSKVLLEVSDAETVELILGRDADVPLRANK